MQRTRWNSTPGEIETDGWHALTNGKGVGFADRFGNVARCPATPFVPQGVPPCPESAFFFQASERLTGLSAGWTLSWEKKSTSLES